MNPLKNIILALCFSLNIGIHETRFSVKPSVCLMPEVVFTNQANYERVKRTKVPKINPPAINLFRGKNTYQLRKDFELRMPLPDLATIFIKKSRNNNNTQKIIGNCLSDFEEPLFELTFQQKNDQLVYSLNQ